MLGTRLQANSHEVLKRIGCIIEYPIFYDKLSARKNLKIYCEYMGYYKKDAISEALALVNLKNVEDVPVKEIFAWYEAEIGYCQSYRHKARVVDLG